MKKNKILFVTGARPNLVKLAPIYNYLKRKNFFILDFLHTNQHSSRTLFLNQLKDLNLPYPKNTIKKKYFRSDIDMISYLLKNIYYFLKEKKPDYVMVFGDVDSTLAAALASAKLYIPIIHIESGLRSKNMNSKEELNRRITDQISKINFASTPSALKNLGREGLKNNSFYVGNIIIENYFRLKKKIQSCKILKKLSLNSYEYILITLHRYQNIDNKEKLKKITEKIKEYSNYYQIVFCIHPRTKKKIHNLNKNFFKIKNLKLIDSLPFTEFTNLLINSKFIITDSGGVLEEAYFHKKDCYVIRNNIERSELINNVNIFKIKNLDKVNFKVAKSKIRKNNITKLWDSRVSSRIFNIIRNIIKNDKIIKKDLF